MIEYLAPAKVADYYFELCDKHNAETNPDIRYVLSREASAVMKVLDLMGFSVGRLIMAADMRMIEAELDNGRPMCGGMFLDMGASHEAR